MAKTRTTVLFQETDGLRRAQTLPTEAGFLTTMHVGPGGDDVALVASPRTWRRLLQAMLTAADEGCQLEDAAAEHRFEAIQ
jgi:hypothetical protein